MNPVFRFTPAAAPDLAEHPSPPPRAPVDNELVPEAPHLT
ncbi:hypothetical protein GA0074694_2130 [Micromonospora inyonensis]|uniref:Uncharacterized protein n=1 Tax=Micromonospora inyonensis TaxID=47866 RepID=A0A1C6RKV3_9ACTN|nr:hypothetical protein GA0074694_2130 [Micromonospora inyonensis]